MNDKKYKSGIYQIVNLANGKRYIGSSINLLVRKKKHFVELKRNKHHCVYLQNAYNKYGKENFKFEIVFYCDANEVLYYEQMGLDSYNKKELYNICFIAGSCMGIKRKEESNKKSSESKKGIKLSKEHCENLRIAHTGYIMPEEQKQKIAIANSGENAPHYGKHGKNHHSSKPIYQLGKITGEVIKEWENAIEAGKFLNTNPSHISACCRKKRKSAGGFKWSYVNENKIKGE
jgi:group I intron endonuclease